MPFHYDMILDNELRFDGGVYCVCSIEIVQQV